MGGSLGGLGILGKMPNKNHLRGGAGGAGVGRRVRVGGGVGCQTKSTLLGGVGWGKVIGLQEHKSDIGPGDKK